MPQLPALAVKYYTFYSYLKVFHLIAMVSWFAGLFYLPRLFVYHAMTDSQLSKKQFTIMEHKLFWYIMTPAAIATVVSGELLAHLFDFSGMWLHIKVALVATLVLYHLYCFKLMEDLSKDCSNKSHKWFRVFNEYPTLILILCVGLVVFK
jgi:putative membrane protein